jgi:hypothetical protein
VIVVRQLQKEEGFSQVGLRQCFAGGSWLVIGEDERAADEAIGKLSEIGGGKDFHLVHHGESKELKQAEEGALVLLEHDETGELNGSVVKLRSLNGSGERPGVVDEFTFEKLHIDGESIGIADQIGLDGEDQAFEEGALTIASHGEAATNLAPPAVIVFRRSVGGCHGWQEPRQLDG